MNIQATAPGKLFIAGEYAVVTPGQPALIAAVNRYLTVDLTPSLEEVGTIYSTTRFNASLEKRTRTFTNNRRKSSISIDYYCN